MGQSSSSSKNMRCTNFDRHQIVKLFECAKEGEICKNHNQFIMTCSDDDKDNNKCNIDFNPKNVVCKKLENKSNKNTTTCYTLRENNTIVRYNSNAIIKNLTICNGNGIRNEQVGIIPKKKNPQSIENITLY